MHSHENNVPIGPEISVNMVLSVIHQVGGIVKANRGLQADS